MVYKVLEMNQTWLDGDFHLTPIMFTPTSIYRAHGGIWREIRNVATVHQKQQDASVQNCVTCNASLIFARKCEGNKILGLSRHREDTSIKIHFKKLYIYGYVESIYVEHDMGWKQII